MKSISFNLLIYGVLAALCVCAGARSQAQSQAQSQTSAELAGFMQGLKTLHAEFRQTLRDGQGRMVEQSSGTLSIRRPNRFRWDYTEPHRQIIVADGDKLWLYDVDLEQVTVRPMERTLAGTPAALLSGHDDIRASFDVTRVERQGKTSIVTLIPKRGDTDFKSVAIGFTGNTIEFMQLNDKLGQITLLEFFKVRRNGAIDDSKFAFKPPPGVDVIGAALDERAP